MSGAEDDHIWSRNVTESGARFLLTSALRRRWPHKPAETLAALKVAPAATVRKWLSGEAFPSGFALLRLQNIGGLALVVELYDKPSVALLLAAQAERRSLLRRELEALNASLDGTAHRAGL